MRLLVLVDGMGCILREDEDGELLSEMGNAEPVITPMAEGLVIGLNEGKLFLPAEVLPHMLSTGTFVHFYQEDPQALITPYFSTLELNRDAVLQAHGIMTYMMSTATATA